MAKTFFKKKKKKDTDTFLRKRKTEDTMWNDIKKKIQFHRAGGNNNDADTQPSYHI